MSSILVLKIHTRWVGAKKSQIYVIFDFFLGYRKNFCRYAKAKISLWLKGFSLVVFFKNRLDKKNNPRYIQHKVHQRIFRKLVLKKHQRKSH